jgi:hypothetical protein
VRAWDPPCVHGVRCVCMGSVARAWGPVAYVKGIRRVRVGTRCVRAGDVIAGTCTSQEDDWGHG